jgi:sRNA-binding carbon storage regulator CsrA
MLLLSRRLNQSVRIGDERFRVVGISDSSTWLRVGDAPAVILRLNESTEVSGITVMICRIKRGTVRLGFPDTKGLKIMLEERWQEAQSHA